MAHVVMQAAELRTTGEAERCAAELQSLHDAYVDFEAHDPSPWSADRVAPPLVDFGRRHGVAWPNDLDSRFALKGSFAEVASLLRVDRMVFFWGGGFDLGGSALRKVLSKLGAVAVADSCHLAIRHDDPDARVRELVSFLGEEDFEDQFSIDDGAGPPPSGTFFSLTVVGSDRRKRLLFEDSGVQEWAFVALLPQLDGEDPSFVAS